jgi:hypothetical protein
MINAPHQTDHARDKIPDRNELLTACAAQATAMHGFDIIINCIADVAVGYAYQDEEGDAKNFARPACNFCYTSWFLIGGGLGWTGRPMAHECPNLPRPLSTGVQHSMRQYVTRSLRQFVPGS